MVLLDRADAVNQVWNYCVDTQRKVQEIYRYGSLRWWPSHYDLTLLTKGVSEDIGLHSQTIQCVCYEFSKSRDSRRRCPKLRSSLGPRRKLGWIPFQKQSRRTGSNSVTYLGHSFRFFGAKKRPLPSHAGGGHFVEDARGNWYVCFHVEEKDKRLIGNGQIGIDLGLKHLVTTNTGEKYEHPAYFRKLEKKLATAQRAGNKKQVRAIHCKIKNQRSDYNHKLSAKLAAENKLIVVGNVSSSKLAKTRMAKSVLDAGWYMLKDMLCYKASRHGASFIEVDERFTTQTCSHCGDCSTAGRPRGIAGLGIREWTCSACGTHHDRDVNAAQNILNLGLGAQPRADGNWRDA